MAAAAMLSGLWGSSLASAQLPMEALLSRTRFGYYEAHAVSSDGGMVAYVVHKGRAELRLTSLTTGVTRTVGGPKSSWGPSWSPDGKLLAFVSDSDGIPRLCVWSRATGKVRRFPVPVSNVWGWQVPVWAPDGKHLFVATNPAEARPPSPPPLQLPNDTTRPARVFRSVPPAPLGPGNRMSRDTTAARRPPVDLIRVDVATGATATLLSGEPIVTWSLSPDGRTVALVLSRGALAAVPKRPVTWLYDVVTLDLPSRRTTVAARDMPGTLAVSFSPDGRLLAFFNSEWGTWARGDCWVAVVGGHARRVTPGPHEDFSRDDRGPVWDPTGRTLYLESDSSVWRATIDERGEPSPLSRVFRMPGQTVLALLSTGDARPWSPDSGRSVVIVTRDFPTLRLRMYTVDVQSGAATLRYTAPQMLSDEDLGIRQVYAVANPATNRLVFRAESMQQPPDLWVLNAEDWRARQLTHLNPALERPLPAAQLIEWRDASGRPRRGALILPEGYKAGQRYPTIVYQYPVFDFSSSINRFGGQDAGGLINLHFFSTRGYAVLLPDAMGARHAPDTSQISGTWRAIENGVARAIELGIADSNRLGIMGHSFGGYGVVSTLVSTSRFRTGVALSGGYYNFPAQFAQMQPDGSSIYTKTSVYQMGCTLWECPQRYVANSPLFFLDRVTASLLLVDGSEDDASQPAQNDQVFIGLQTLGQHVEYALYPGEGHDYSEWTRAHQIDFIERVLRWLDTHLKADTES